MYARDPKRRHGALVAGLLVLALLATLGLAISVWLDRQALSDQGWSDTSVRLLANQQVRTAAAAEIVSRAFARARIDQRLRALPGPLGQAADSELHRLATGLAVRALQTTPVKRAWRAANSEAHRQLLADIERDRGRDVYLQLTPILNRLLAMLRHSRPVTALPGPARQLFDVKLHDAGRVRVLRADQVDKVRVAVNTIRNLLLVLSLIAAICFVLAVVSATGRHLRAIAYVGACLAICGGVLLGARALAGPALANALVPASEQVNRAAVRATWSIGTSQLQTVAIIALVAGGLLLIAGVAGTVIAARRAASRPVPRWAMR